MTATQTTSKPSIVEGLQDWVASLFAWWLNPFIAYLSPANNGNTSLVRRFLTIKLVRKNLANALTVATIPTTIILSYYLAFADGFVVVLWLMIGQSLIVISDGIDGFMARECCGTSRFGAKADGIRDRLMFFGMMLALYLQVNRHNSWTSNLAFIIVTTTLVLILAFEIRIGMYNNRRMAILRDDFTVLLLAKLRFAVHAAAMTLPWLLPWATARAFLFEILTGLALATSAVLWWITKAEDAQLA